MFQVIVVFSLFWGEGEVLIQHSGIGHYLHEIVVGMAGFEHVKLHTSGWIR